MACSRLNDTFSTATSFSITFGGDRSIRNTVLEFGAFVSVLSEIELLGYPNLSLTDKKTIESIIETFTVVDLTREIKNLAIEMKSKYKLKTVDSIVAASAIHLTSPLFTADKDFRKVKELEIIFYEPS